MKGEKNVGWQPETQPKGKPPVEKTKGAETMQRLIDADALKEWIRILPNSTYKDTVMNAINDMPTIDEEPVRHGKWIKADSQQYFRKHYPCFTCSECGYRKDSQKKWNYCPNCGARMDVE